MAYLPLFYSQQRFLLGQRGGYAETEAMCIEAGGVSHAFMVCHRALCAESPDSPGVVDI